MARNETIAPSPLGSRAFTPWTRTAGILLLAGLSACSIQGYKEAADQEALAIIHQKQKAVFGEERPFQVEPPKKSPREKLLRAIEAAKRKGGPPPQPLKLNLRKALDVAALTSREYQDQKEILFLSALNLSTARWEFDWHPTLTGNLGVKGNRRSASASGKIQAGLSKTVETGASILAGLLNSFSRTITSGRPWDTSSLLSLSLTQPLLQGFGARVTLEPLTQAERDVIYAVRAFERYRRDLVVRITSTYFRLLQQKDQIRIEEANLKSLELNLERNKALQEAGKLAQLQVDQNRQSVLNSKARLLQERESLKTNLDNFKITLGLPVEAPIELDMGDFERLRKAGLHPLDLTTAQAQAIALAHRLDLKTARDQLEDAKRKVLVAADALKMGLDLNLDLDTPSEDRKPGKPRWRDTTMGAGVSFDFPLDKTRQRNQYRRAIVSFEKARRRYELQEDSVLQQVRARLRDLRKARQDYEIQKNSVLLAKRRVDEAEMKQQAGRAIVRDVLEAQDALRTAQNSLVRVMIDHFTTRLELLRDLDVLKLDPKGLSYDDRIDLAELLPRKAAGKRQAKKKTAP